MRRTIRGAAAVAAICAGALTMTSVSALATEINVPGVNKVKSVRVAGVDRVQTSLEALDRINAGTKLNVLIVGYNGVVDALSLPPLAKTLNDSGSKSVVLYAVGPDGLDKRVMKALEDRKADLTGKVAIAGGYGVVPANVEKQLEKFFKDNAPAATPQIVRMNGSDRYETAYLTGAFALNWNTLAPLANAFAKAQGADAVIAEKKAAFEKAIQDKADAKAAFAAAQKAYEAANEELAQIEIPVLKDFEDALNTAQGEWNSLNEKVAVENLEAGKLLLENLAVIDPMEDVTVSDIKDKALKQKDTDKGMAALKAYAALTGKSIDDVDADDSYDRSAAAAITVTDTQTVKEAKAAFDSEIAKQKATPDYQAKLDALAKARKNYDDAVAKIAENNTKQGEAAKKQVEAKEALDKADKAVQKTDDTSTQQQEYIDALTAKVEGVTAEPEFKAAVAKAYAENSKKIIVTTGMNFADALTAGPAAVKADGIVLLTNGAQANDYVESAVKATSGTTYVVGGVPAPTFPKAKAVFGKDRYETAAKVAVEFFKAEKGTYALASGQTGADAVVAGVYQSNWDTNKAVLLTQKDKLPTATADFVQFGDHAQAGYPVKKFLVFGGEGVVSRSVVNEAAARAFN